MYLSTGGGGGGVIAKLNVKCVKVSESFYTISFEYHRANNGI